mgnify:CR=1 FL=1
MALVHISAGLYIDPARIFSIDVAPADAGLGWRVVVRVDHIGHEWCHVLSAESKADALGKADSVALACGYRAPKGGA